MGLQQFEQRLERLVEGAFAKAFRGELQPIELGRKLTREMDLHRAVSVRGIITPNVFQVFISVEDYARFDGMVEVLERELADAAREHARSEGYTFLGAASVDLVPSEELARSTFTIITEIVENDDKPVAWLVTREGDRIPIVHEPLTVGRLPDCDIPIHDPNVSRRHAQFRRDGEAVYLFDLGSTNGTRVNGTPVRQHRLVPGDTITVGMTTLRFELD